MEDEQKAAKDSLDSSLEYSQPKTSEEMPGGSTNNSGNNAPETPAPNSSVNKPTIRRMQSALSMHWSIYLPILVIVVVGLIVAGVMIGQHNGSSNNQPTLSEQNLSPSQLNHLAAANQVLGSSNQVLTVQSGAIFNSTVLVRGQLEVAGQLQISQLQINKSLAIAGNAAIQGTLSIQNDLSVNGNGSFAGNLTTPQLTTNALQLNGNLTLTHHLVAGGPIPSRSTLAAAGSGGTTSVNGSDTAGTVTINTGNSPSAGCFIAVNFTSPFLATPHMLLTPVGASSATLNYYVTRSTTGFNICSVNSPQAGQSYVYDYFVID